MLEEDAMHIGTEADVTGHVLDISGKKTQLRGLLDTGAVLSVIPIETWERMGFDKGDSDRLENTAVGCKQRGPSGAGQDAINSPQFGGT